ncbi:MAG: bifunctional phosphopantothenoylcysteine decarboxylase/phosphopantothenate--cysteine ligase CoaBC [Anaerolineae bacterium]
MNHERITLFEGRRIILGVTGSIAAYKAVDLASKLTQAGALVDVIMTEAAQQFVTPLTFRAVTGRGVYTDMWQTDGAGALPTHIAHVGLAEGAALLAVIPATADSLARLAHGLANDLLSVTALAARCPLVLAPAMDGGMYAHPAVQANLRTLIERGALVIEPEEGRFASGLHGKGRLPETATLIGGLRRALGAGGSLAGRRVVVTAGGTREPIDPVRYITNRSSGKQGYALAQAALDAGADVTLITSSNLPDPVGARIVHIHTAAELFTATLSAVEDADALIMAAAVADFRPRTVAEHKIKKSDDGSGLIIEMERNPDILAAVTERRRLSRFPRVVVGFAAESHDLITYAQDKLKRKGLDLLVANDITATDAGFEVETNRVILIDGNGIEQLDLMSKTRVSETIIGRIADRLNKGTGA